MYSLKWDPNESKCNYGECTHSIASSSALISWKRHKILCKRMASVNSFVVVCVAIHTPQFSMCSIIIMLMENEGKGSIKGDIGCYLAG